MKGEKGQALAIVLGVMTVLFLLLGAVLGWSSVASKQYGGENPNLQATAALRGGVEGVVWELRNDGDGANPSPGGTDVLDTANKSYTPPSSLFPVSLCQLPDCSGLTVAATLQNPAVALHIVGPATVYEGTTTAYGAYATDAAGRVVSTKSLGIGWTAACSGNCAGKAIGSSTGLLTAPTGDSGNENCHNCDNNEGQPIANVTVTVSSSVAGASVSVAVDDEP